MKSLWLGLGSNIGNRAGFIRDALNDLKPYGFDWSVAAFYQTAPRDMVSQPDFLNTVTRCRTEMSAVEMLKLIHMIELKGGRDRASVAAKGPRTIDIDILLYGKDVGTWEVDGIGYLTIPHPSMHERLFVLRPLLELNPDLSDPRDGVSWRTKASHLSGQRVKLYPI